MDTPTDWHEFSGGGCGYGHTEGNMNYGVYMVRGTVSALVLGELERDTTSSDER